MSCSIRDTEPSPFLHCNVYHMHVPLFVLDTIRLYQDHPRYRRRLHEKDIVELMKKLSFASGDIDSQVKTAIKDLQSSGFVRFCQQGFRTLGPYAKLALARTQRQYNTAWDRLCELQTISNVNFAADYSAGACTARRNTTCV